MIPNIFNLERENNFRERKKNVFFKHDFLHKEVFLNHLDSLDMIIMDMPHITFVNVPDYFMKLPITESFLKRKKTTQIHSLERNSEILPYHIKHQHAVIALLCCNTINDLVGFLTQIKNCLAPDGIFIASFIGDNFIQKLKNAFTHAELDITGKMTQRFHPVIDIKQIGSLLQRAQFSLPLTHIDNYSVTYKNPITLIQDIRGMGYSNCLTDSPSNLRKDVFFKALANLKENLVNHPFDIDVITAIGRAYSDYQQKSLLPGSATISLKDALK